MLNGYKKSESALMVRKIRREMIQLKEELHDCRYHFERKVEQRTEHLLLRIAELESLNAALCDQLARLQ
jgi:hypothetical protein